MNFFLTLSLFSTLQVIPSTKHLRSLFAQSTNNKVMAEVLLDESAKYAELDVLYMGYHGAAKMIMAKHLDSPFSKLSSFNDGKKELERAIQKAPENVELIFLRYTIQRHAPSFLGYRQHVQTDEAYLKKALLQLADIELKSIINSYFSQS